MNTEFFNALELLEKEKGIPAEYMIERVEAALISAFKREEGGNSNVRVVLDPVKKDVRVYKQMDIVEEVEDEATQLTLEQAQKISKRYKLGGVAEIEMKPKNFRRLSAQTAKQVIIQGIREAERSMIYEEFTSKEHEILTAQVNRIDPRNGGIVLEIAGGTKEKADAFLSAGEQVPGEVLTEGDYIKIYVVEVKNSVKGPQILISRTHPGLVKRLFELEVPEIQDGTVIIHSIAREAGSRTKISVWSRNKDVDPIGSWIGVKGMRKTNITNEIAGEKIDIIEYSENPEEFIKAALSPAQVIDVTLSTGVNEDGKLERGCTVIVPQDQLSLAIGNKGQNARLAAKITGYKIDIKSQF